MHVATKRVITASNIANGASLGRHDTQSVTNQQTYETKRGLYHSEELQSPENLNTSIQL